MTHTGTLFTVIVTLLLLAYTVDANIDTFSTGTLMTPTGRLLTLKGTLLTLTGTLWTLTDTLLTLTVTLLTLTGGHKLLTLTGTL